jgi:hypothetical protein
VRRQRGPRDAREAAEWRAVPGLGASAWPLPPGAPLNAIANDRGMDLDPFSCQSEVSLVVLGTRQVAAWNDGEAARIGGSAIGWAWSDDDGATWHDGGAPPESGGVLLWTSDPVLAVDARRERIYLAGMAIAEGARNAVAVVEGGFEPGGFRWGTPVLARSVRDTLPDKPWIAADSLTGALHLAYTTFFRPDSLLADQIEYQRRPWAGGWSPPQVVSLVDEQSMVQGARPAIGPGGEVQLVWSSLDTTQAGGGRDRLHARRSVDGGVTFGPRARVTTLWSNFGSGAPGFNRGFGFAFPAIAVDRSRGPHRGRTYVAWHGAVNFYDDPLGTEATRPELESNNAAQDATPFIVGETVRGGIDGSGDVDHLRFSGTQGRTAIFFLDSAAAGLDLSMRVVCSDGATRLAWSAPLGMRRRFALFTLPLSGSYLLRLSPNTPTTGPWRLRSGWDAGGVAARDHRDVFVAWSDDGLTWSEPLRVNDEPGHYDDWLPEVAVGGDGTVWMTWYDWNRGPVEACGGVSGMTIVRSEDGGETWIEPGPMSDELTAWSAVSSNVAPNHGDYVALVADHEGVAAGWADGRFGNPDVAVARRPWPSRVELLRVAADDAGVGLEWEAPSAAGVAATVERREGEGPWAPLATVASDSTGRIAWRDETVEQGARYGYRLAIVERGVTRYAGEADVVVPGGPAPVGIERAWPNPAARELFVRFTLPDARAARLELVDLAGRRVRAIDVGGRAGRHVAQLGAAARPGIYWVRLVAGEVTRTTRVAVVR